MIVRSIVSNRNSAVDFLFQALSYGKAGSMEFANITHM